MDGQIKRDKFSSGESVTSEEVKRQLLTHFIFLVYVNDMRIFADDAKLTKQIVNASCHEQLHRNE